MSGVVTVVGAALTVVTAWFMGLPAGDTVALLGLAGGGAIAAAVVGGALLRAMRTASLRAQAVAVALIAVFGTFVGVVLAAGAMFVSSHDLGALLVVLVASATVAVVVAVRFGSRIGMASRDLEELARRIGDGDVLLVGDVPVAHEMRRLATELAEASQRLEEARVQQKAMEASRRELIAWVSHDLRTPLAGIRAMVEALQDGVVHDRADVAAYHQTMQAEVERLSLLVDDLFELSRIEAGALELRFEQVTLDDVVSDAVAATAPVAAAKGVELRSGERADDVLLSVAPVELTRVVRNLLDNAVRHTPPGGTIEVHRSVEGDRAVLWVEDGCGGIDDADLDRVFDPAFRGDASRTADGSTGGLGLAIARGLVDAHDGRIDVANAGAGCRFTVRLPLRRVPPPVTRQ